MASTFRGVAVIPCLNEARTIASLVSALRADAWPVWVVDDGSTDATASAAAAAGADVLRHETPEGKGASLRAAWERARSAGFDWALCLDGDGQHLPAEADRFRDAVADGRERVVVGNRFVAPGGMPAIRRWTNRWMSRRLSGLAGVPLPDSQCGYRLVPVARVHQLALRTRHFEIESELLVAAARAGIPIEFVPVSTRYGGERSKIAPLRDALRWWRWWRTVTRGAAAR